MSDRPEIKPYKGPAGGWGALRSVAVNLLRQDVPVKGGLTLLHTNQPDGFDCPGCAWPDREHASTFEFCENGAKAVAFEATSRRVGPEFFAKHSVEELARYSDYWLEDQGRLTHPMRYNPATGHYEPVAWDEAFAFIASKLNGLASPDEAIFYTSGRTSNEAAFLYQLFVRQFGTNNLPDCSNMCHESSGTALTDSIGIGISDLMTRWGVIDRRRVADYVRSAIAAYRIRATGPEQPVGTMSGGNQQKALLARVLGRNPTLVVLDEPTRGVDVGAKADVHALVDRLSSAGQGVLMISSDLPELLAMSDRLYVMHEGRMTAELQGASLNEEQFMRAASGLPSVAVDGPAVRRRPGV